MRDRITERLVGRVVGSWRYPVKSMGAEPLAEADVSWFGVAGDRRWAFVRTDLPQSGFPWLTLREHQGLRDYRPRFVDANRPDKSPTVVLTPSGAELDVTDPALRAEINRGELQVIRQDRGIFDTFPLALITTQSIASISTLVGIAPDVQRFRPNFLIEAEGELPYPEDDWVGCVIRIGTLRLRVDKRDGRCGVITIDPQTGERNTAVFRAVAQNRQGCLGVYGTTVEPGRVALGDKVLIEEHA